MIKYNLHFNEARLLMLFSGNNLLFINYYIIEIMKLPSHLSANSLNGRSRYYSITLNFRANLLTTRMSSACHVVYVIFYGLKIGPIGAELQPSEVQHISGSNGPILTNKGSF